jgi:tRNA-uridine 2-sulfurtransferase
MKPDDRNKKVVLGLSGGVDSAVAAYLLKEQGYEVFGVFLRNWTEKDEKGVCPAERDREDAMRVAAKLGIAFSTVDYEKEYRERVFAPFVAGLNAGINPNPDILCNPLVKFAALCAIADEIGAAWIATGHYARLGVGACSSARAAELARHYEVSPTLKQSSPRASEPAPAIYYLKVGIDKEKDQSYFLSRITQEQLARTIFPLGEMTKTQTRELARKIGLHLADKEGTSGICFIGERNFENFMKDKVAAAPGPILDTQGRVIGEHRGLPFYTVGQRHGFGYPSATLKATDKSAGGEPYYVAEKRVSDNALIVAPAYDSSLLRGEIFAVHSHWISGRPAFPLDCQSRLRYRQPLQSCKVWEEADGRLKIIFQSPQKAVTPGQYAVFYDGDICLGSATII